MYDILIKNGTVIDGTGNVGRKLDVGVEKDRIVEVAAKIPEAKGRVVIDAKDKFVTPGFIDIQNHSDSYFTLFDQPQQSSLLAQGITSIVVGNCGSSLAPLASLESIKTIQKWHDLAGVNINWVTFGEFVQCLSQKNLGVNVLSLVGHATVRRGLLKDSVRPAQMEEMRVMKKLVDKSLDEGAVGLSMGLIYAHEVNSSEEELKLLVSSLKPRRKFLSIHLRSEASHILEAVDEAIDLATASDVALKISHLKVRGQKNWHLFDHVLNKLEIAYHQGLKISFDVYPYDTSWSVLYTYLPKWAYEAGRAEILRHSSAAADRRKILDYLKSSGQNYGQIVIATAENNPGFVGKTLAQIASNQGVSVEEAMLNTITACRAQVVVFDHNLSDEQVELLVFSPLSIIASDGAGYEKESQNLVHPRCFGAMPKFLRMVREKKTVSWEMAIKKLTMEPAGLLNLKDRGKIAKNTMADIVVFDPVTVTDLVDYEHPYKFPLGIETVLINGKIAFADNKPAGLFGKMIGI